MNEDPTEQEWRGVRVDVLSARVKLEVRLYWCVVAVDCSLDLIASVTGKHQTSDSLSTGSEWHCHGHGICLHRRSKARQQKKHIGFSGAA